ncbi:MAG: ATP-binding protein [Chitinophagales bacterium]
MIIYSKPESIVEVEKFVETLCSEHNIDDSVFGNMLVSITEAVNNAIIHGNKRNPEKKVNINYSISDTAPKFLSVNIIDEGDGFDFLNLPDPTAPENLEMIGGRGVFLIKQLADFVIFSDKGNAVELQFKL